MHDGGEEIELGEERHEIVVFVAEEWVLEYDLGEGDHNWGEDNRIYQAEENTGDDILHSPVTLDMLVLAGRLRWRCSCRGNARGHR